MRILGNGISKMKASHELFWNDKVRKKGEKRRRERNNKKLTDALKIQTSCKVYVLVLKGSKMVT